MNVISRRDAFRADLANPRQRTKARPIWTRSAPLALLLSFAGPTSAAPLTLDVALRMAEAHSLALPAQDASAAAARHLAVAAGQRPDPVLTAGINNLPVTSADRFSLSRDFMTMRSVGVMQQFTRGSKLEARSARFEREADAAAASRALALAQLQRGPPRPGSTGSTSSA